MGYPDRLYLGLGSNSGDSPSILRGAISGLAEKFSSLRVSSFYRSKPRYVVDQPDFLNCVVSADLPVFSPRDGLRLCQEIEAEWGRNRLRERPKGERTLDIDILLWGSLRCSDDVLTLPHRGLRERKFVLLPLVELDPSILDPCGAGAYLECLDSLPDQGIYYSSLEEYATIPRT
jgi:2-amino-4-hydroxy-6-hydroxymethyldihydropteridine diphosphokinase